VDVRWSDLCAAGLDLTYFRYRQIFAASDAERRSVELRHLLRLSMLALLAFGIASLAMLLQLQFSFDWITFMVLVLVLSLLPGRPLVSEQELRALAMPVSR